MSTPTPLLDVRNIAVEYGGGWRTAAARAVDDVSLTVGHGEIVGLVGESGSGKSSIGRAVLGLTSPAQGTIHLDGQDVTHQRAGERRDPSTGIQVVFQDPYASLNPARTIGRTLGEPLEVHGKFSATEARTRIEELLTRVGLPTDAIDRYPSAFSGGQRQRIAIARAISTEPKLVICDEPTSALDVVTQARMLDLLTGLSRERGTAMLFIAHNLAVVAAAAQRVVVLYRGRVMESGTTQDVLHRPLHPYTQALIASSPVADPLRQRKRRAARKQAGPMAGSEGAGSASQGCPFAPRCPHATPTCRTQRPDATVIAGRTIACHLFTADDPTPEGAAA
ncbi:ABC transporter ATP-binding protein [Streptomyces sp. NPDC058321]|uniref:ABC transporter ATP-binding protein n=1 Tax=Streptomyces sp. NPDC058321 TaxID=3346445 RepID=UPI0036E9CA33